MGPADRPDLLGKVFISQFDPRPARAFVMAGIALFALAGLGTLALVKVVPLVPLICIAILVFHFAPALWPSRPAIELRNDGFRLDGLGLIPWEAIGAIAYVERALGKSGRRPLALLEVNLVADFALAIVRPDPGPIWRKLQVRHWRKMGDTHLTILVSGLSDGPRDIRNAFEVFLGYPINGPRGLIA